jgi:hypothetical protein
MKLGLGRHRTAQAEDDAGVITMTASEYDAAVSRALRDIGLTYSELAHQAARRQFSSNDAADLWPMIRRTYHPDGRRPR